MDSQHLLVPIKVQALVVDDLVITKKGAIEIAPDTYAANDGRWSPQLFDYEVLPASLSGPGPTPFYGATRTYNGQRAEQLVLDADSAALPSDKDRGVYLHWVLPSGLRRAYTPGLLDFPALPDHWLIVRFARRNATMKTNAWFVDGGSLAADAGPANLLFADNDKYTARHVGKVVPLEQFASANFAGDRTTITALGNSTTGSPTFTAFIAENRNVFSWHDKLEDQRQPNAEGSVPQETTLSYLVVGWYRDPANEALASSAVKVTEKRDASDKLLGFVIDPPGWFVETNLAIPDLLKRRSVFHGMVAHVNYWSTGAYKGHMLGYPGAPRIGGAFSKETPPFQVGVGNNPEDALVSLVSSSYSGEQKAGMKKDAANLWQALEAVIYRQPETLIRSWSEAPRDHTVHQNWFATHEAGKLWFIRPKSADKGVFPKEPAKAAAQAKIKPTNAQLAELQRLNEKQAEVDAITRDLAALQQELYTRWWRVAGKSREFRKSLTAETKDVSEIAARVRNLQTTRDRLLGELGPLPDQLRAKLPKDELELKYDAAPRFWLPADPVLVVKHCGCPTKHQFPRPLPCRLPEQIVTTVNVDVNQNKKSFSQATGVAEIAAAAQKLPACPPIVNSLVDEASLMDQAVADLAERTLPDGKQFNTADSWQGWVDRLTNDLTWDGQRETFPKDPVTFDKQDVQPHRLVELWGDQPWAPLFLDWQITWFPSVDLPKTEDGFGPVWPLRNFDYKPLDQNSIPKTGYTVRGRSILSPIDGRIFDEPIETLRHLLAGKTTQSGDGAPAFPTAVADVLSRYEIVWDKTLGELKASGLMGQALTGFHQALLRRDVTLPRVMPDPARPWIAKDDLKTLDTDVSKLLDAPNNQGIACERLAPPTPPPPTNAPTFSYSMIRAGALRIDELWLVDDFGQSADLLGLTPARSKSMGQIFHPRIRWHNDQSVVAMPPRVLQPARLNFRFVAADNVPDNSDPALRSICGWIFFNPLDRALVLCDRSGDLMGELVITKAGGNFNITWDPGAGGVPLEKIPNENLKNFARSLIETNVSNPRSLDLLNLIDRALERIRPAAARNNSILASRPLALVNATIGLELFGKAWTDPHKPVPDAKPQGTGDALLDALKIRVNLGSLQNVEDGLVGYFKNNDYTSIVVGELPKDTQVTTYVVDPASNVLKVGFGPPENVTLLMDPWGSVQAACGLVPAKSITLAHPALDETVAQMETSFRVGPVLLQPGKIALPTPAGDKGTWSFIGPDQTTTAVAALDPRSFSDRPVVATEGRLVLLNEE